MTDDERLGALFRAAASDSAAPEPGFDHQTVVRTSRRITVRRRAAVTVGGLALFAIVGIGGTLALPGPTGGADDATVAAPMLAPEAPSADSRRAQQQVPPPAAAESAPGAADAPLVAPAPGAAAVGGPPLGPGTGECADRQDPALRSVVEEFLPEVVGAPEAAVTEECRPGGERGVNLEVRDGARPGLLTVQYLPPGVAPDLVAGAVSAPTASGGTVVVSTRGDGADAPAPFADRLDALVTQLAPRL
ncbi:hypothetical protein FHX44_112876 [Pseudonocardia hierapolitana]|uniref:Uncharacterized protein n=1 Tax=Pseudonocardia hierapolitana TaxID=1128676 RepID=A0A561SQ40_9PSEU|nr:hypothetical protein [Pseudonocardia hierapolitana]TWF76977.1 hypothetical protein FHX44_112876 [Pseudonocardia hierapolitana]